MPMTWWSGRASPKPLSRRSLVVRDRPAPPANLASNKIIVLCPECGERMRLATAVPTPGAASKTAHFDCACGYALQQAVAPL